MYVLIVLLFMFQCLYGQEPPTVMIIGGKAREINEGDDVTLECRATGNPTPVITWSKFPWGDSIQNSQIPVLTVRNKLNFRQCLEITQTQTCYPVMQTLNNLLVGPILRLKNVTSEGNELFYFCRADNGRSEETIQQAHIFFKRPPIIGGLFKWRKNIIFCTAYGFPPASITLEEQVDGRWVPISVDDQNTPFVWEGTLEKENYVEIRLLERKWRPPKRRTYRCRAEGLYGSDEKNLTIGDSSSSYIRVKGSREVIVNEGDDVTLQCEIVGVNNTDISWTKFGGGIFDVGQGSLLQLRNISYQREPALYHCEASAEGVMFDTVTVYVRKEPKISLFSEQLGTVIKCSAEGFPGPDVQLFEKRGSEWVTITSGTEFFLEMDYRGKATTTLNYQINNLRDRSKRVLKCTAENVLGQVSKIIGNDQ